MSRRWTLTIVLVLAALGGGKAPAAEPSDSDSRQDYHGTRWRGTNSGSRDSSSVTARVTSHKDDQLVLVTHGENGIALEWTFKVKGSQIALTSFRQTAGTPQRRYREEKAEGTISSDQISFSYSYLWDGPQRKNVPAKGDIQLKREK
jgi:hypothetical protein